MKIIPLFIIFCLLFSVAASAFVMSGPDYKLVGVISDGGARLSATSKSQGQGNEIPSISYKAYVSVAQPVITPETKYLMDDPNPKKGKYKLCLGIFCTGAFDAPHSIRVSGKLKYATGEEVASSDAKIIIRFGEAKYEGKTIKTDADGVFSVDAVIPESIAGKDFSLEIYAKGKVEASYTCTYDQATGYCR